MGSKNDGNDTSLTTSLVKHLLFERILPLLPIESTLSTYSEVENLPYFGQCRTLIMNIAIAENLNSVIEQALALIDLLVNGEEIISDFITIDVIQSVLVVLRLLCDIMEYCWDMKENGRPLPEMHNFSTPFTDLPMYFEKMESQQQKQDKLFSGSIIGFSTHRPNFHKVRPNSINPELVPRFLLVCSKLKFNTRILKVVRSMSQQLYGNTNYPSCCVLEKYHKYHKLKNNPSYADKIDLTISYMTRFVAAANPKDYKDYIDSKITKPLLVRHTTTELGVAGNLDLFGYVYLTSKNVIDFIDEIKSFTTFMKRTIYHSLLLYFASKAFFFWIMARPEDYRTFYYNVLNDAGLAVQSLSPSPVPLAKGQTTSNISEGSKCSLNRKISSLFDDIYTTFNVGSLLTTMHKNENDQMSSQHSGLSSSSVLLSENTENLQKGNVRIPFRHGTPVPESNKSSNSNTSPQSPLSFKSDLKAPQISNLLDRDDDEYFSNSSAGQLDQDEASDKINYSGMRINQGSVDYLDNVLELYSDSENTEISSLISILRILVVLVLLDPITLNEIATTPFKYLSEGRTINKRIKEPLNSKEKDKGQGIKHFTHNLKKLTSLPSSKKHSPIKFINMMIRNLTGTQIVSDMVVIDSVRALLMLMTMSCSISLIDAKLPSNNLSQRLFALLGHNLQVGQGWREHTNQMLISSLERFPLTHRHLQLEFFSAAIQLDPDKFLGHLRLDAQLNSYDISKLCLYTDGFRVFFHLSSTNELKTEIAQKTCSFLKELFSITADKLLRSSAYFNDKVRDIIAPILDGTVEGVFDDLKRRQDSNQAQLSSSCSSLTSLVYSANKNLECTAEPIGPVSRISQGVNNSELNLITLGNLDIDLKDCPRTSARTTPIGRTNYDGDSIIEGKSPGQQNIRNSESASNPEQFRQTLDSSRNIEFEVAKGNFSTHDRAARFIRPAASRRVSDEKLNKFIKKLNNAAYIEQLQPPGRDGQTEMRRIMMNILSIFKRMTNYFLFPQNENDDAIWLPKDFINITKPIFVSIIDHDFRLQVNAQSFMDVLINNISSFDKEVDKKRLGENYLLCSYTITLFSATLFDMKIENLKRETIMSLLVKFCHVRTHLSVIAEENNMIDILTPIDKTTFPLLTSTIGGGLFASLYCNSGVIPKLQKLAFGQLLHFLKFYEKYVGELDKNILRNINFVEAMSQDTYATSGSMAFQRRLRNNILKYVKKPDEILINVMDVIFDEWDSYNNLKEISQDELADFRSLAGILASMSGILQAIKNFDDSLFPTISKRRRVLIEKMNYFVSKQCNWLNNPDLLTRENSRDILSIELHPLSFNILFDNLKLKAEQLKGVDFTLTFHEPDFVLLEQLITIIRIILRREDEDKIMLLFSTEIVHLIDKLIEIVGNIPINAMRRFKAIIQISKMFRSLEYSESNLGLKNHYHLKNKWLKVMIEWFKIAIAKNYDMENISRPFREMNLKRRDLDFLYIDTAIESSRALAYLTYNVPLEVSPSGSQDELKRATIVAFGNNFSILLKGLEKSTNLDKYPVSLKHKISILNENVINSLTYLSNANVDESLNYTLPMGYSKDKNIKTSFLKVFINIISHYPEDKNSIERDRLTAMDKLLRFVIKHPSLVYRASTICSTNEIDAFVASLLSSFESRNATHILVNQLITDEIGNASGYTDVLRRNSCATKVLSLYARTKGKDYLARTLRPVIKQLVDNNDDFRIEKIQPDDPDCERQVKIFLDYLTKFIDVICESLEYFPKELIVACQTIYRCVREKFPDSAYIAVGSFVFLRFIGPSIVSPDSENIYLINNSNNRRALITIAKTIQSMANGSENVVKWSALSSRASYMRACSERIMKFLAELCSGNNQLNIKVREDETPVPFDYHFLHKFLYLRENEIREKVLETFTSMSQLEFVKESFFLIDDLLGHMGRPKMEVSNELPNFILDNVGNYPRFYEFMTRHAFRNPDIRDDSVDHVFEGMTKHGIPCFTVTCKQFSMEGSSLERLVYRSLQIYCKMWLTKHYIIYDCTGYYDLGENWVQLHSIILGLLPDIAIKNCLKIYYINANETFIRTLVGSHHMENEYYKQVPLRFLNSSDDIEEIKALGIPSKSLEDLKDFRVSLQDISLYSVEKENYYPVSVKIGNNFFQVLHETSTEFIIRETGKKLELNLNDVYQVCDLTSVNITNFTDSSNEFTLFLKNGQKLIFRSQKFREIVKLFQYTHMKAEEIYVSEEVSETSDAEEKAVKESRDIICHLCLVILASLFSDDKLLKNISYNLIVAIQDSFDLDMGTKYHMSPEVYVPDDVTTFLFLIAKALSESHAELTPYMWKYMLHGLENDVIPHEHIPTLICCLSYWIPNVYKYICLETDEDGLENFSKIIRSLIKLTLKEPAFTTVYLQQVWYMLNLDGRLTEIIVEEVINHALDRDSEGSDWKRVISLVTAFPTAEVASEVVNRLMKIVSSFLPTLRFGSSEHSWSELSILVKISVPLFFESLLITQMFIPEILFAISILIDTGPSEVRMALHELLMNVCHSLSINESLPENKKMTLNKISSTFAKQRLNFTSGFSQEKGRVLLNISATSFSSRFATLEHFIKNIMLLMENGSTTESNVWKTRFKKYVMDSAFNHGSFLSARAMMILGVLGTSHTTPMLCKNMLIETMKIFNEPRVTDEQMFIGISHNFAYSKIVLGLDSNSEFMKQMFWISTIFVESPHPVLFEGGLQFMISCVKCLYTNLFKNSSNRKTLASDLIKSRLFAQDLLKELEEKAGGVWTEENFCHLMLAFISRGLSIPVLKVTSLQYLQFVFKNSYQENKLHGNKDNYLCYMLILYMMSSPDEFEGLLKEIGYEGGMITLVEDTHIPIALVEWLREDGNSQNLILLQGSMLFSSTVVEEPSKIRFISLLRYLLLFESRAVLKIFSIIRLELRRFSSLEQSSKNVAIVFDVLELLTNHPDFSKVKQYSKESIAYLHERGLVSVTMIDTVGGDAKAVASTLLMDSETIYHRKRLTTLILSRVVNMITH